MARRWQLRIFPDQHASLLFLVGAQSALVRRHAAVRTLVPGLVSGRVDEAAIGELAGVAGESRTRKEQSMSSLAKQRQLLDQLLRGLDEAVDEGLLLNRQVKVARDAVQEARLRVLDQSERESRLRQQED